MGSTRPIKTSNQTNQSNHRTRPTNQNINQTNQSKRQPDQPIETYNEPDQSKHTTSPINQNINQIIQSEHRTRPAIQPIKTLNQTNPFSQHFVFFLVLVCFHSFVLCTTILLCSLRFVLLYVCAYALFRFVFFSQDVHRQSNERVRAAAGPVPLAERVLRVCGDLPVLQRLRVQDQEGRTLGGSLLEVSFAPYLYPFLPSPPSFFFVLLCCVFWCYE